MKLQQLYSYTRKAIDHYQLIESGDKIAIGISGGKDSLTLLYALSGLRRFYPQKFDLVAVTVDLGYENFDLTAVSKLCHDLDVSYHIVNTEIAKILFEERNEKPTCSLCAKMRKGALNQAIKELGCNKVAYAHHMDDVIETANHFRCIDLIIDNAKVTLTEKFIKNIHLILKNGTSDLRKDWFAVGNYKRVPNEVGGMATASPEEVSTKMKVLLGEYARKNEITFEDILDFHVKFERIHPFQDGNGRVGRLLMFKECLKHNIVPFIIEDDLKMFYYRGLKEWNREKGYLMDTCLTAQDCYKAYLDYFRIPY